MAEYPLLKDSIDASLVGQIAGRIAVVHPAFPSADFVAAVTAELDGLELKARNRLIAAQLRAHLPSDYARALRILLAMLDEKGGYPPIADASLRLMAIAAFVELYGAEHPAESLAAMTVITRVSSCEFAIRPLLERHPQLAMQRLHEWAASGDEHLRRLASEGSRPRLPWASQLRQFIADPSPTLALLERLKDDPSLYVRRSVANHLNDIGKDHPERLLERMEAWAREASAERMWLIKHALRSLVKAGDRRALAILGYGEPQVALSGLTLHPTRLLFGAELRFSFQLQNASQSEQKLMVDYMMRFRKANGRLAPKVFKLKTLRLGAGESATLAKTLAIRPISTRRYYPGRQRLEIQVNGRVLGGCDFELVMDQARR